MVIAYEWGQKQCVTCLKEGCFSSVEGPLSLSLRGFPESTGATLDIYFTSSANTEHPYYTPKASYGFVGLGGD